MMDKLLYLHRGIDDLPLPIDVDLLADNMLSSEDVRNHISRHGRSWWTRKAGLL